LASDVMTVWMPAAVTSGCLRELAEVAGPVLRRRATSAETPPAIAALCDRTLQVIPGSGAYAVLHAAAEKLRVDERMSAVSILLAIGGQAHERLAEVFVAEPDRTIRGTLAKALGAAAGAMAGPLARVLSLETPLDRLARAFEVVEPLLTPALLTHFADLAEKGRSDVRREILRSIDAWPMTAAQGIVRRLILSGVEANRDAGIEAAGRLKIVHVSADVGLLLEGAKDERLIRLCCRYFASVPNPSATPLLERIVARKPRMFGLVKGYSEETRAEAAKALASEPGRAPDAALGERR
jgi:hypothetical protein